MLLTEDRQNFYNTCIDLVTKRGIKDSVFVLGYDGDGYVYDDPLIYIACSLDFKWVEIERKAEQNPIIWVEEGVFLRFDYDYVYLWNHINKLKGVADA